MREDRSKWIRTERAFPLPSFVKEAIQKIEGSGHVVYVVGGAVRDFLLGRPVKDQDLATSADPELLHRLFPNAVTVGKAFGVLKVPVEGSGSGELLEIATFREDLEYVDHRHPSKVRFAGPLEDARRRDFTINALFYDPKSQRILDAEAGHPDLQARVIRAIGDPVARFREDALRLLRAPRFAANLGFQIDAKTAEAIRGRAHLVSKVSAERIRDELKLMLTGPHPDRAFELLCELGLIDPIFPELIALKKRESESFPQILRVLKSLARGRSSRGLELGFGALLFRLHRGGTEAEVQASLELINRVLVRLRLSTAEVEQIRHWLEGISKFREAFQMRDATLLRWIAEPRFDELLELYRAIAVSQDGNLAAYEFCRARWEELPRLQEKFALSKMLTGADLIQLGLTPNPRFSEILRSVEDLVLEGKLRTKDEALQYVLERHVR